MMDLPLNPVGEAWQSKWDQLIRDAWLVRKLDRTRRMREHWQYVHEFAPELLDAEPGYVLDLGPGAGELLEIARYAGHMPIGLESPSGEGGMGDAYLDACKLMLERQKLPVMRDGLNSLILMLAHAGEYEDPICKHRGEYCLINSRGSIEQMFADCMCGPPHHLHHDCSKLRWNDDARTRGKMFAFFDGMADLLRPGGTLLIAANGSANTFDGVEMMLQEATKTICYVFVERSDDWRVLKWKKRTE